ncbi:hypothetical protein [Janthinobacterium sp. GW458P]|uniref:hypothetical protein n=1 Tax=Janthinobacterium sp. GW458P TaxID=1981504 RepID=UPI00155183D9|nr:hypothetical protein [Janthinobacterium sp. GW458P]
MQIRQLTGIFVAAGRALVDGMADKQIGQWHGALPDGIFLEKILNPAKSTNKVHGFDCTPTDKYGQQKTRQA